MASTRLQVWRHSCSRHSNGHRQCFLSSAPVPLQQLTISFSSQQVVIMAVFNEMANGANFSLTPHTSPYSNGLMTGLVGAFGNMGGVFFALIFRYCPANAFSQAWWISGVSSSSLRSLPPARLTRSCPSSDCGHRRQPVLHQYPRSQALEGGSLFERSYL